MYSQNTFTLPANTTTPGPNVALISGIVLLSTPHAHHLIVGASTAEVTAASAYSMAQHPFRHGLWYTFAVTNLNELVFHNGSATDITVHYCHSTAIMMGGG